MTDGFKILPLETKDAPQLSAMLCAQSPSYVRFFTPFSFDQDTLTNILARQRQDIFMGIYWQDDLAGFFMLRGWDEGYEAPSYGVMIDERYSGYGLTRLSLKMVKSICKLRQSPRIMLKVHPENTAARSLFEEARFSQTGVDAASGHLVYHFDLNERSTNL
ncbi:MAG: GNAT family N-acetyltransferase [Acidobacteria bacterium]|jgi:RimJ/RimL family protein N-acetyltransferase|nr:GNAT family N-acetyltransferase [Acidobacteriota bacterium]